MLKTTNSVINASQITGTVPVANGGTGLTSLTAGYIPYGNGTSAFSSSSSLYFSGSNLGIGTSSPTDTINFGRVIDVSSSSLAGGTYYRNSGTGYFGAVGYDGTYGYLGTWGASAGAFRFYINSSEKMRLDTSGNLGIGTTSPNYGGWSKAVSLITTSIAAAYEVGTSSTTADAVIGALDFIQTSNTSKKEVVQITARNTGSTSGNTGAYLTFSTKPDAGSVTEAMRIFASGGVSIGTTTDPSAGNLQFASTSKGIYFGSSSLLSDYEEGTWTPSFSSLTVTGSPTYSGKYTKIGRVVYISWQITTGGSATTSSTANTTSITNLPYTVNTSGVMSVSSNNIKNIGVGMFYSSTTAYTPTWIATTDVIYGSGCYTV